MLSLNVARLRNITGIVFISLLCLSLTGVSLAEEKEEEEKAPSYQELFEKYVENDPQYNADIKLKAQRIFKLAYPSCDRELDTIQLSKEIMLDVGYFQQREEVISKKYNPPNYGQWVEKIRVVGCGETAMINILVTAANSNKRPMLLPLLNGETKILLLDQIKAEKIVGAALQEKLSCVGSLFVLNTKFLGYRKANGNGLSLDDQSQGWFERWNVRACDSNHNINMAILPDPNTQYRYIAQVVSSSEQSQGN